jgi:hypothetical protein
MRLYGVFSVFVLFLVSSCGLKEKVQELSTALKVTVTSQQALEMVKFAEQSSVVSRMTGGVASMIPSLPPQANTAFTVPLPSPAPSFLPEALGEPCDPPPSDRICTVSFVTTSTVDPVRTEVRADLYLEPTTKFIDFTINLRFSDGGTGTIRFLDQEAPNGTTEADLLNHRIKVVGNRFYPAGATLKTETLEVELKFFGKFPPEGPQPDIYSLRFTQHFSDDVRITVEIYPSSPVKSLEEANSAEVTRTTEYPSGRLKMAVETIRYSKQPESGMGKKVLTYGDNTTEYEILEVSSQRVTYLKVGRDGTQEEGEYLPPEKKGSRKIRFPQGHTPLLVEENFQVTEEATGRKIVKFQGKETNPDGSVVSTVATLTHTPPGTHTLQFEKTYPDGKETGEVTLLEGVLSISFHGQFTAKNGLKFDLSGEIFKSGKKEISFTVDDPATSDAPDITGNFHVEADGTGQGEIITKTTIFHFTVENGRPRLVGQEPRS